MIQQPIATATIVAQTFRHLELSPFSSFGDDTQEASAAREQYPLALRACLEHADWSFASHLANLPAALVATDAATDPDLPYAYVLPADFVAVREMFCDGAWRLDDAVLRAEAAPPLRVRYTKFITDETRLPARFQSAVALELAVRLRHLLTQIGKRDRIVADAETALRVAARYDARNASPKRWDGREDANDWADEARR